MKGLIFLFTGVFIATSCMNVSESKSKKNCPPKEYFSGRDLKMAEAIYAGNIHQIENLIKTGGYNVNGRGENPKYTYLGYAVLVDEVKSAETLLLLGADVNSTSMQKNLALRSNISIACDNKNKEMINLLLKYHVNLNPPLDGSPIEGLLIGNVDKSEVDLLLNKGADINHKDYVAGDTPLISAYQMFKFDYVNYFLDKGANPLQVNYQGNYLAYLLQKDLDEHRLNKGLLDEMAKLKHRLETEFHVVFPVKSQMKKSLIDKIKRYESLSGADKTLLGPEEKEDYEKNKERLEKGLDGFDRPLVPGQ